MKAKNDLITDIESIKEFELRPIAIERDSEFHVDKDLKGVVIVGENDIIATVSNKYKLIQFRDVFLPAIKDIADFEGEIATYKGKATLYLFPEGSQFFNGNNHRIGLLLKNSVDKSNAIEIRFSVLVNGYFIVIPQEIKQFRKIHTGKALEFTQDFLSGVNSVKDIWGTLVQKYREFAIDDDTKKAIYDQLKLTKKVKERIDHRVVENLWELFMCVLDEITRKQYKSEIHKNKKIETICNIFYHFGVGVNI
jgi:hypothetical protein